MAKLHILLGKYSYSVACNKRNQNPIITPSPRPNPDSRYQMSYDQPCQIDCRVTSCMFYKGAGVCANISPAITLNENGKFVCWSETDHPKVKKS